MNNYSFGAGDFKLGERVEVITTGQRGILVCEMVHLTGCNTYQVLFPNIPQAYKEEKKKIASYDYLLLRKLKANETVFGIEDSLNDENIFSPKGTDVNSEWIHAAMKENKEPIPEADEAIGAEDIKIQPGTEVWHKVYNKKMLVYFISRDIYSKELLYGMMYMNGNKEVYVNSHSYALIPMEQKVNIYTAGKEKKGPILRRTMHESSNGMSAQDFIRYGGSSSAYVSERYQ